MPSQRTTGRGTPKRAHHRKQVYTDAHDSDIDADDLDDPLEAHAPPILRFDTAQPHTTNNHEFEATAAKPTIQAAMIDKFDVDTGAPRR